MLRAIYASEIKASERHIRNTSSDSDDLEVIKLMARLSIEDMPCFTKPTTRDDSVRKISEKSVLSSYRNEHEREKSKICEHERFEHCGPFEIG